MSRLSLSNDFPRKLAVLVELALDLRWTWSHAGDALWCMVDAEVWERTRNPWTILQDVSRQRLEILAADPDFMAELKKLLVARHRYQSEMGRFGQIQSRSALKRVAYFAMEFGLGEGLPLYAGGLGILAGDYLKTASDLGVPAVGVGLLYQVGYFRQMLDAEGRQQAMYPYNDPASLPIERVETRSGGWLHVSLALPGRTLLLRIWRARVGRTSLYLLDSNDPLNSPTDRGITGELYGGGPEVRLMQEVVLGIGGWRALEAMGVDVDVCHLNEGHAALMVLERARAFMQRHQTSFWEALWATRAGNVFTTHTPVPAGFDAYPPSFIDKYFPQVGHYVAELGLSRDELLGLARCDPRDGAEPFSNTRLLDGQRGEPSARRGEPPDLRSPLPALARGRGARRTRHQRCACAELGLPVGRHAVDPGMWQGALARVDGAACRRHSVRDGRDPVGAPCQAARGSRPLRARPAGPAARPARGASRGHRLGRARPRSACPHARLCAPLRRLQATQPAARPERLRRLLASGERPVQIIVAGKAHRGDEEGKRLVHAWAEFVQEPSIRNRAVFLEDYDMSLAQELVQAVDVWINTPRRPWEACGTSGMKLLVNGGLNFSELDGWWAEAYRPDVGWALGGAQGPVPPAQDAADAEHLYQVLEDEIIPAFFTRDAQGIPRAWVARIRASMSRLAPEFSSNRMMRDYVERCYLPAAAAFRRRKANRAKLARELRSWWRSIERHWAAIRFVAVTASQSGDRWDVAAEVCLGTMPPGMVRVELYADQVDSWPAVREVMEPDAGRGRHLRLPGERGLGAPGLALHPARRPVPSGSARPDRRPGHPLAAMSYRASTSSRLRTQAP